MARVHGIEIADLDGTPQSLKEYLSGFLGRIGGLSAAPYASFAEKLAIAIKAGSQDAPGTGGSEPVEVVEVVEVVELCAGHGGPSTKLRPLLRSHGVDTRWLLSDLRPPPTSHRAMLEEEDGVTYVPQPVDATAVPDLDAYFEDGAKRGRLRLINNAFHHFQPEVARAVLADAIASGDRVAILEVQARHPLHLFAILFSPLTAILLSPTIKPWRWSRLFWVLSMIGPLVVLFDGIMSCLRVYAPKELDALTEGLDGTWESGRLPMKGPGFVTYLIGTPP